MPQSLPMPQPLDTEALVQRFDAPTVRAIVLAGSYARGDQHALSDVDLMLFGGPAHSAPDDTQVHLIDGRLVVVSSIGPAAVEAWFTRPEQAVEVVEGLRRARALVDRNGTFARIQTRAQAFEWDDEMQSKADAWASKELAGQAEEVQKGLAGVRSGDTGRLLNARFGLSWRLSRIVQVQRGVLLSGDNAFFDEVEAAVTDHAEWIRLRRRAFGVEADTPTSLREQVTAGLWLYVATAEMLAGAFRPDDGPVIEHAVGLIRDALPSGIGK